MRSIYDQAVASWEKSAVPYDNYRPFAKTFARQP